MRTARRTVFDVGCCVRVEHQCHVELNETVVMLDRDAFVVTVDPLASHGRQDGRVDAVQVVRQLDVAT